ncbi:MAG: radical SAM/SPASM domain-containing protein [Candidatus Omnitrophota bacterium]
MSGLKAHLELTNICNLECSYCPKYAMKRKLGYMDKNLAIRLIDELSGYGKSLEKVFFHLMGEPLMHPNFMELVHYAVAKKIPLSLYSNGSLLNVDRIRALLNSNLKELIVSFQTPAKDSFKLRKDSLGYDDYLENIKNLILEKIKSESETRIELRILNTAKRNIFSLRFWFVDRNLDVFSDKGILKNFLADLNQKLNKHSLHIDIQKVLGGISMRSSVFTAELFKGIFVVGTTYFSWYNFEDAKDPVFKKARIGSCDGFMKQVGILWDGSVTSCCVDYNGDNVMGSVVNKSIREVLSSQKVIDFISKLKHCLLPTPYCRICRGARKIRVLLMKQLGSIIIFNLARIGEGK